MNDIALLVRLQARVAAFLAEMPAERLVALAEGRVSLAVVDGTGAEPASVAAAPPPFTNVETVPAVPPVRASRGRKSAPAAPPVTVPGARKPAAPVEPFDPDAVVAQLRASETLEEAGARLAALKLKSPDLKLLAKALNISPARNMAETAKRILNLTVGARGKHAVLRQG